MKITYIYGYHTNTCDFSYLDQFVIARTRSSDYQKCIDQFPTEIMLQIDIARCLNVRAMAMLIQKVLPSKKVLIDA